MDVFRGLLHCAEILGVWHGDVESLGESSLVVGLLCEPAVVITAPAEVDMHLVAVPAVQNVAVRTTARYDRASLLDGRLNV